MASEPSSSKQKCRSLVYNSRVMSDFRLQISKTLLPTYRDRLRLLKAVHDYQVLIIVGQNGSGKTTQIPQYLHEAGFTKHGQIACTQPWGVVAKSAAIRVSNEMHSKIGDKVGYSIGFEHCTSTSVVIKYITDRLLLNEVLYEPNLDSYSVIMVDEANERTVATDLLLALVKNIVGLRKDLKLLISSATLVDAKKISEYFGSAPVFHIEVKQYPVDISFTHAPVPNYIDAVIHTVLDIYIAHKQDILVFLVSQEEIEKVDKILKSKARGLGIEAEKLIIFHAHANLRAELQAEIFEPSPYDGACKVVLATNIAETAFKIGGIRYVVDPGFYEVKSYNPQTNMESLSVSLISKRSAMLRAESSDCTVYKRKCFRLYTEYSFQHDFLENTVPEIQRTNPANLVLMLNSLNITDLTKFDFMDPPCLAALSKAHEQFYALNVLNRQFAMRVAEELRRKKWLNREKGKEEVETNSDPMAAAEAEVLKQTS